MLIRQSATQFQPAASPPSVPLFLHWSHIEMWGNYCPALATVIISGTDTGAWLIQSWKVRLEMLVQCLGEGNLSVLLVGMLYECEAYNYCSHSATTGKLSEDAAKIRK